MRGQHVKVTHIRVTYRLWVAQKRCITDHKSDLYHRVELQLKIGWSDQNFNTRVNAA